MAVSAPIILAENILESATLAATDTETGYDVANIIDRRTYTLHQFDAHGTKYITATMAAPTAADTLAIISHNLGTAAAAVSVEWSADGASWTEVLAAFTPTNDRALLKTFTSATKGYWRIKFVTAAVAVKVGVVFLGTRITLPRTWPHPSRGEFDPMPEQIVASSVRSKTGNLLGSTLQYVGINMVIDLDWLTDTWVSGTFKALWDTYLSQLYPVFVSWDPGDHPTEVLFGKVPDDYALKRPWTQNSYRRLSLEFEGVKE